MNVLPEGKRRVLQNALRAGYSCRAAARIAKVAKATAENYRESVGTVACACGRTAGHKGLCVEGRPVRARAKPKKAASRKIATTEIVFVRDYFAPNHTAPMYTRGDIDKFYTRTGIAEAFVEEGYARFIL